MTAYTLYRSFMNTLAGAAVTEYLTRQRIDKAEDEIRKKREYEHYFIAYYLMSQQNGSF